MNACVHIYTKPQTSSTQRRGPGWRIHGSVENTKLSTNKQHSLRVSPSQPYNAGRAGLGWGGGRHRGNVYAACSSCVVFWLLIYILTRNHKHQARGVAASAGEYMEV